MYRLSLLISLFLFFLSHLYAQSMMVQIPPLKDNTLYEDASGSTSNGEGEFLFSGTNASLQTRRCLLAFDVAAQIPSGATIDSVFLTLNCSRTLSGDHTVEVRKALQDWGEGSSDAPANEGGGTMAASGDATWLHTFYDNAFWNSPGGDFSATVSATQAIANSGFYTWGNTSQLASDVQDWLDNPENNFGWVLVNNESAGQTAKRFDSRENLIEGNRPVLTVYYSVSTAITRVSDEIPIRFNLYQNFPNPFNPTTEIRFDLPQTDFVKLAVYNLRGQKVSELVNQTLPAGSHSVTFNASNLSSGVYWYALEFRGSTQIQKMIYLR